MSEAGGKGSSQGTPAPREEGALIRLLAPTRKSLPRLLITALLLVTWIAVLIGLYLTTVRSHKRHAPTSPAVAMAFPR